MKRIAGLLAACILTFASPHTASAAGGGEPQGTPPSPRPELRTAPDFLLKAPQAWLAMRGSLMVPRAGGDLFAFVTDQLTLGKSDFRTRGYAADLGIVLGSKIDLVVGTDITGGSSSSEYRRFVTASRTAIAQTTEFRQKQVSAGVRVSPFGRGRAISQYAFIPSRFAPYVGGGLTTAYYNFSQIGQFVDFKDLGIFNDQFASDGWAAGPYVNGGVDVQLWKRLYLSLEGRYSWMQGGLDTDFSGFDGIDLAGFRGGTGINIVF
ncbi:MAG: hypothetical protein U0Q55_08300 [Vicinamibacterales bacterium]